MPFRTALKRFSKDEVYEGLRALDREFLRKKNEMFRLIVEEISVLPTGWDLLEHIDGTPAAEQLRANIEYQNQRALARMAYAATQEPAAIAKRREERKAERLKSTALHRERKRASQDDISEARRQLDRLEDKELLRAIAAGIYGAQIKALGGIFYKRLHGHFRSCGISPSNLEILSALASNHGGHWAKLFERFPETTASQTAQIDQPCEMTDFLSTPG